MLVEKLLESLLDEQIGAEPTPEKKKARLKLVDPLRRFPLGKIEAQDRADDQGHRYGIFDPRKTGTQW